MTSHKIEMNINEIVNVDEKKQETTTEEIKSTDNNNIIQNTPAEMIM